MISQKVKIDILEVFDSLWLETIQNTFHDVYHLPGYVALEAKRSKALPEGILIREGNKSFFVPYLVRECNDVLQNTSLDFFDITSPYGYPGILISEEAKTAPEFIDFAFSELKQALKFKGICSAFFRLHPLINSNLNCFDSSLLTENGQTVSVNLRLTYEQMWNQTKPDRRNKINKCRRLGFNAKIVDFNEYIHEFIDIYEDTMQRVGARKIYLDFDYQYCLGLKEIFRDKLHLCVVETEGKIASAGLYTEYNGIVQALFGGTRSEYVKFSPSSLETDYIRKWAKELGNYTLHLGGGLGGTKNSLFEFKASFSKQRHSFKTIRLIIDEQKYNYLVQKRAKYLNLNIDIQELNNLKFFPAYRTHNLDG